MASRAIERKLGQNACSAYGERAKRGLDSGLLNRVFREDLFHPFESLFGGGLRRHPAGHDVGPPEWPDMLVLHLRIGGVERPIIRYRRAEQRLRRVGFSMRVREPPRVAFDDRRHARDIPAEPDL